MRSFALKNDFRIKRCRYILVLLIDDKHVRLLSPLTCCVVRPKKPIRGAHNWKCRGRQLCVLAFSFPLYALSSSVVQHAVIIVYMSPTRPTPSACISYTRVNKQTVIIYEQSLVANWSPSTYAIWTLCNNGIRRHNKRYFSRETRCSITSAVGDRHPSTPHTCTTCIVNECFSRRIYVCIEVKWMMIIAFQLAVVQQTV